MSHSQFHSTNLFILRHAWLNLWDKHMTTGRINQVTTFQFTKYSAASHLSWQEFISLILKISSISRSRRPRDWETTLFPDLTSFQMQCFLSFVTTKIMPFSENYLQSAKTLDHGGFSSVLIATRLAISKWSTFFPLLHCEHITTARLEITIRLRKSIPNQHILLRYSIIDSAQGKPANPLLKTQRHTQIRNDISTFEVSCDTCCCQIQD
jgi:hypothetical protein